MLLVPASSTIFVFLPESSCLSDLGEVSSKIIKTKEIFYDSLRVTITVLNTDTSSFLISATEKN